MRTARGLSQREVVRRLGLSAHSNLVDYELGRRIPPGDIVVACEQLYELPKGHLGKLRSAALLERAAHVADQPPVVGPMQLPAGVAHFTGRTDLLCQLDALLAGDVPEAVVISAIAGTAGIGKPNPEN